MVRHSVLWLCSKVLPWLLISTFRIFTSILCRKVWLSAVKKSIGGSWLISKYISSPIISRTFIKKGQVFCSHYRSSKKCKLNNNVICSGYSFWFGTRKPFYSNKQASEGNFSNAINVWTLWNALWTSIIFLLEQLSNFKCSLSSQNINVHIVLSNSPWPATYWLNRNTEVNTMKE